MRIIDGSSDVCSSDLLGAKVSYNYADSNFETQDVNLGDEYNPVTETVAPGLIAPAGLSGYSKHVLSAQAYYEIGSVSLQAIRSEEHKSELQSLMRTSYAVL